MKMLKTSRSFIFLVFFVIENLAVPTGSIHSLVVRSAKHSEGEHEDKVKDETHTMPQIYQMQVRSSISNRFARSTVISRVKNFANEAQQATFSVVLPEGAFISVFIMEVDGKNYTAHVEEKEEAQKTYDQAVASGQGAAHVAVSARDSNRFTVSVNIEPETKAAFYLTYEELLKRRDGHYELIINLHPGQPVDDLNVEVIIVESRKITNLKAPPLRSGNEIDDEKDELDPRAVLEIVNDTSAIVKFSPNLERQKQLAHLLGTNENDGLAGQFVVQYDVERDAQGGEVLVQDGYFVHFFAPSELPPLPKHVVFVLDISSSMYGQKIQQLKEAMLKILDQLHENDVFHLVEFNSAVKVWELNNPQASVIYTSNSRHYGLEDTSMKERITQLSFPKAYSANAANIKNAKDTISRFVDTGSTDIHSALTIGLYLVQLTKEHNVDNITHQPMIIFLTDGQPNVDLASTENIIKKITEYNTGIRKAPTFTLSFGDGADKDFLQKLALKNAGFSRHIYEAADATLQLQDFYNQISSPLLANVTFKYESSATSLTTTNFPIHFGGSELVVTGCFELNDDVLQPTVDGWDGNTYISFRPTVQQSFSSIERLWAYLTIKQLLEKNEISDDDVKELKKKALDLALKYSFVTPVSSLVVIKPNATAAVDTEAADKSPLPQQTYQSVQQARFGHSSALGAGFGHPSVKYARFGPHSLPGLPGVPGIATGDSGSSLLDADFDAVLPVGVSTTTSVFDALDAFPWLQGRLTNDMLYLRNGWLKFGRNETISDQVACPKTPFNSTGQCKLFYECPQIHYLMTSFDVFTDHLCILRNEYAGICCPDDSQNNTS